MVVSFLPWVSYFLDWRSILIVFLLLNLKSIPLSWHLRALFHFLRHHPGKPYSFQHASSSVSTKGTSTSAAVGLLFGPATITTRSPMLESDFNWHKSNSTYFSDLDISRLVLMTRIYFAGFSTISRKLASEGHIGRMSFTLGSVYCSFQRPLRPYADYKVSSKVLAWDRKWLYIVSWFWRKEETAAIACAVSKYVCKKGRFTVPPERLLRASGLLRTHGSLTHQVANEHSSVANENSSGVELNGHGTGAKAQSRDEIGLQEQQESAISEKQEQWEKDIETERLRGMEAAKTFIDLEDVSLSEVTKTLHL